jgi:hypothetical protein
MLAATITTAVNTKQSLGYVFTFPDLHEASCYGIKLKRLGLDGLLKRNFIRVFLVFILNPLRATGRSLDRELSAFPDGSGTMVSNPTLGLRSQLNLCSGEGDSIRIRLVK